MVVGAAPTVLIGPLPDTALIKNVRLVQPVVTQAPVIVKYGVDGITDPQLLGAVLLDSGPRIWTDGTWLVLEPGETLVADSQGGSVTTSGHGTLLTGGGSFP